MTLSTGYEGTDNSYDERSDSENRKRLYAEKLTDDEVDLLYDIMEVTAKILEGHNIRYTIEGGSLLGAVRNGGLIPHDNDGDFDVLESDLESIISLGDEFAKYDLVVIKVPGWGLQIAHKDGPELAPGLWTDGISSWTSRWPFLDLISIQKNGERYELAQDVARQDYPHYHLLASDWELPFEKIQFGHLQLYAIGGEENRIKYLDRHYPNWNAVLEMNMDHRANTYFDEPIKCVLKKDDIHYRKRSVSCSKLSLV
jgi:lipopolysaccharide cholinephosphotransferase